MNMHLLSREPIIQMCMIYNDYRSRKAPFSLTIYMNGDRIILVIKMKLVYKGKFDGNIDALPKKEHEKNAVKFREFDTMKGLALFANILAIVILIVCFAILMIRGDGLFSISFFGAIASMVTLFPHEFLHAVCFKETVYMYTNFKQGLMFVTGTENMTKTRFVFMSLLPNIIFGFVPFIIFLIFPSLSFFGTLGALAIGMGAGDYYNVFNCLTQVPKGGKIYMYGMNSYWFMPEDKE